VAVVAGLATFLQVEIMVALAVAVEQPVEVVLQLVWGTFHLQHHAKEITAVVVLLVLLLAAEAVAGAQVKKALQDLETLAARVVTAQRQLYLDQALPTLVVGVVQPEEHLREAPR
jgi:hypothetical protein